MTEVWKRIVDAADLRYHYSALIGTCCDSSLVELTLVQADIPCFSLSREGIGTDNGIINA